MGKVTSPQQDQNPDLTRAIGALVQMRDYMNEAKRESDEALKAKIDPVQEKYEQVQAWVADRLNKLGTSSAPTAAGTAYFSELNRASITDWGALSDYIRETGDIDLLEHRVSKSSVEQHLKDREGELPPGVGWSSTRSLNIRKPAKSKSKKA